MKTIQHPAKICVPVEVALRDWNREGGIVQQKMDGQFATREIEGVLYAGELMRGGQFYAFDVLEVRGVSVAHWPLKGRWQLLCSEVGSLRLAGVSAAPSAPSERGAEFLADVLAAGGEGCVLKDWGATYGTPMIAAKRAQIHTCIVAIIGPGQSITLKDSITGQARGKCPAGGGKADRLRGGSLVRVECETIHESGLFRSAKLCREFLVKF